MKKRVSFQLFFTVVKRGICQVLKSVAKLFGYKKGTTFGKAIWRICATCISITLLIFTIVITHAFYEEYLYREWIRPYTTESVYEEQHISNNIVFQDLYYKDKGRVYDKQKDKTLIEEVDWVVSEGNDSLVVFAKDNKRGYLNRFTGEIVLPATYTRAWIFSEGLAAVEKDGNLVFIDHQGREVINTGMQVSNMHPCYAFHNGYCVVHSTVTDKLGLLDTEGNWALQAEYDEIELCHDLWKVNKDDLYGVFTAALDTMYKIEYTDIYIHEDVIEVRGKDHIAQRFDHEGNLLVDFVIDDIENMEYATDRLYDKPSTVSEDEYGTKVHYDNTVYAVAKKMKYSVYGGCSSHYGLIDRNGKRITPPKYTSIEAIGEDIYLCQPDGVVIDGNGNIIK